MYEISTGQISAQLNDLIKIGLALPYEDYVAKVARVETLRQTVLQWWQEQNIDVLIAPAAPGMAPLKESGTGAPFMSRPWQVLGLPTVTVPMRSSGAMPLAVQLIGKPKCDDFILAAAGGLAQAQS